MEKRGARVESPIDNQENILNGWGNIYWVDTSFVEKLRPEGMKTR